MSSKQGTKIVLVIETYAPWNEKWITEVENEFVKTYDGNFAIRQAYLESFESYTYEEEDY